MPTQNDILFNSLKTGNFAQIYGNRVPEPAHDAFGRARVSDPLTVFDCQFTYNKQPYLWNEVIAGSANSTHLPNESSISMSVTTGATDSIIRQTKEYFLYQPGKSVLTMMTFCFGTSHANNSQKLGYFDTKNGIYLEYANSILYVCKRSYASGSIVNTRVAQTDWNIDNLTGNGGTTNLSNITLNPSKSQILLIDLEWLGVGRVRVGFVINGAIIYVHEFLNANVNDSVYMTSASLPVRYEISNSGSAVGTSMKQICSTVISEGGVEEARGIPFVGATAVAGRTVTSRKPIMSIRAANNFNSIINRTKFIFSDVYAIPLDASTAYVEVVYNGVLTNATFSNVSTSNSAMEIETTSNAIANGIVIDAFYISSTNQAKSSSNITLQNRLPFTSSYDGTTDGDTISIVVTPLGGTTTVAAAVNWKELR